ncbi:MAG: glycosyltransferase family 2 protein [Candidatus Diapherotrites archaeon]|uniref:Glycosyltransferase family 2 protein n=1 Tax=Candidatus Iainarchaeum sp. TaxID=3101447 RepID=A0A939CA41_9ARCH|nr:glycosyltransferase family 2 protein [Candidatus Diapherotrites archaeon]
MAFSFPKASIVIPTHNNASTLRRVLDGMLKLNYPNDFEVIVVNDGSTDNTREMLKEFGKDKRIKAIDFEKNQGVCNARNAGIAKAKFPVLVNMDHDCIPEKGWLKQLVAAFEDERVGAVSSFGDFGGTSTAFRKELLEKVGGYDTSYGYYREDTDLTFRIMELGYEYRIVKAGYLHDHQEAKPSGKRGLFKYFLRRMRYHQNDVLLFKKHPKLASEFLDVKLGFLVNPAKDFKVAANLWEGSSKNLKLCSPRGIVLIENKSPLHALLIIFLALIYMLAVKASRLAGSVRYGRLLI